MKLFFDTRDDEGWVFVCADKRLVSIARKAGCEVIDPTEGPDVDG